MKKKIIAILIAAALTLSLIPAGGRQVLAESETETSETETSETETMEVQAVEAGKEEPEADAEAQKEENFEPVKIQVVKEGGRFLEIYWDRDVAASDEEASYVLKSGDTEYQLNISDSWKDRNLYYNINGKGFTSFMIYGYPYTLSEPVTLEIRGDILDAEDGSSSAVKKVYPVEYGSHYTQTYTSGNGILCQARDEVAESSLKLAGDLTDVMLANMDAELKKALLEWPLKISVYGPDENIYSIPENRTERDHEILDVNKEEGYPGHRYDDEVTTISEANLIRSTEGENITKYPDESILVHEFAHTIKNLLEYNIMDPKEIAGLYKSRKQAGLWANTRAMESTGEFFAFMTEIWFQAIPDVPDWSDGTYCPINTREELKQYDPETYAFMEKIYGQPQELPSPWNLSEDNYANPQGAGITTPEPPAEEGNHFYSENEYQLILKAINGRTYIVCTDGEYGPCMIREDGLDSSGDEVDSSSIWKVNRTEDGCYQLIAAYGPNRGKALIENEIDLYFGKADPADRKQLWRQGVYYEDGIGFVNADSENSIGSSSPVDYIGPKKNLTTIYTYPDQMNLLRGEEWTLRNLNTGAELIPHASFDFSSTEFRITSAADSKSNISFQNGISMQNGKDSTKNSWWLDPVGDSCFYLESTEQPGQVLAPANGKTSEGTRVTAVDKKTNHAEQLWLLEIENGKLRFRNYASGLVIAAKSANVSNGTELILAKEKTGENTQLWIVKDKRKNRSLYPSDIPNVIDWEKRKEEKEGVRGFVNRLYRNILGRKADAAGLESWIRVLQEGKEGGSETVANFVFSPEYEAKHVSDDTFVTVLYRTILGREPDKAGKEAWISRLNDGMTRRYLVAGFTHSPEFQKLCQSYGIQEGNFVSTEIADQNDMATSFVSRLYTKVLQRNWDRDGLDAWTGQLIRHETRAGELSKGFFFSREFQTRYLSQEAFVDVCYRTYLNREPDTAGRNAWVKLMQQGHSQEEILDGFIGSQEFGDLCAAYGIER